MVADLRSLRFYVDESALGLGMAMEAARKDTVYPGHKLIPECPLGSLDVEWIPAVAARDLVVIARDKHIRTKPQEIAKYREAGLRAFWIAGKKDMPTWMWLTRFVRQWDAIERTIAERGAGPWFYSVTETGLTEITV